MELSELFRSWEDDLVSEAVTELRHARLQHYLADGEEVTRERVGKFIERALERFSIRRAEPMIVKNFDYVEVACDSYLVRASRPLSRGSFASLDVTAASR